MTILDGEIIIQISYTDAAFPPKSGSKQVPPGAHKSDNITPNISIEKFLSMLRFEQRGNLIELPIDIENI